ncbi:MAG: hypothetical protein AAGM67_19465 [Bacteroidota bacterium]
MIAISKERVDALTFGGTLEAVAEDLEEFDNSFELVKETEIIRNIDPRRHRAPLVHSGSATKKPNLLGDSINHSRISLDAPIALIIALFIN